MASLGPQRCAIALLFASAVTAKYEYSFKLHLSDSWFEVYGDGTQDTTWWRLCNNDDCGVFIGSVWSNHGATYSYTYEVPWDLGSINRVDMVHTGSDMLGLDWIEVDGNRYEPGGVTGVWSVEYTGGSSTGCDVSTVTSDNNWYHYVYSNCIYWDLLDATYQR